MAQQKFPKAYEAYQQAVYRDGRNPTFWCSIGVLYYQINQYRDALDAYSRAIRLNPYISEVWYDLGTLVRLAVQNRWSSSTNIPSTNLVTIKQQMRSMLMHEPLNWTQAILISKLV
jgi:cytochrome c-type biogenesis protein CcmH/NrfG